MFDPGRGSLDAWMTTIARNTALDWRILELDSYRSPKDQSE
jgi:hypothetical protein